MSKIKLEIYIGKAYMQSDNVICTISIVEPYLPKGDNQKELAKFEKFYNAGTYIADWYDFVNSLELDINIVEAKIYLNAKSKHKVFRGKEILEMMNKINEVKDILALKEFPISWFFLRIDEINKKFETTLIETLNNTTEEMVFVFLVEQQLYHQISLIALKN